FRASTPLEALRRVNDQQPQAIRSLNPAVPVWLEALILRLLGKDPADCIQSAAGGGAPLEGYLAHPPPPGTVAPPRMPRAPQRGRAGRRGRPLRRWVLLAAGAVSFAAAILGLFVDHGLIFPRGSAPLGGVRKGRGGANVRVVVQDTPVAPKHGLLCVLV